MSHSTAAISSISRSRNLARQLGSAIRRGQWSVGQALPSTRQIAREQRMSLATVQAGLRELEQLGLVERQPRRGTVVKSRLGNGWHEGDAAALRHVGVVVSGQSGGDWNAGDSWAHRIARAAEMAVERQKLQPTLLRYDGSAPDAEEVLGRIEAFGGSMAGVILFNGPLVKRLTSKLDEMDLPWVVINRWDGRTIHNFVAADNLRTCRLLGECFARMGLHRVLVMMVNGVDRSETEKEKITGMIHGFMGLGAPIHGIDYMLCREENSARRHVEDYLEHHEPPQAIFALNDDMASGAIAACVDAGLSIPRQVKIVGGAGVELAMHTRPTLSVAAQPMEKMGRAAGDMLVGMIQKGTRRADRQRIAGKLILRESLPVPPEVRAVLEQGYPGMISG